MLYRPRVAKKSIHVDFKVEPAQLARWRRAAERDERNLSDWMRRALDRVAKAVR